MTPVELVSLFALGFFAGALGGLVGVGGSIVIIPILTLVMKYDQHLSQATAMIINIFVAGSALLAHERARAVRWDVVGRMVPIGLITIIVGVEASNALPGDMLTKIYGAFLLYVIAFNAVKLWEDRLPPEEPAPPRLGWWRTGMIGGLMGFVAGLLGIGGGPVNNPLLQRLCHLPLRDTIAVSSAVMSVTAMLGALRKNLTLSQLTDAAGNSLGLTLQDSLALAAVLAPTATVGALIGAGLTHRLPVGWVRVVFIVLMGWASARMLV